MLILELYYHLAFDVAGGPSKETMEFESTEELEALLKNFPALSVKNDTVIKRSDRGELVVGRFLQDAGCELG